MKDIRPQIQQTRINSEEAKAYLDTSYSKHVKTKIRKTNLVGIRHVTNIRAKIRIYRQLLI